MRTREKITCAIAALAALLGLFLVTVRGLGMRFSGFLLLGLAALLLAELVLDRWAERSRTGWRCQLAFRACCAVVLVPLVCIEGFVLREGRAAPEEAGADAVIVLGAGVNGTEPSLSLRTRLDAALAYLEDHPDVLAVLTGGTGYGEEISEARCMYNYLTARGIDPERLLLEEQASNTAENFAFSKVLLEERGFDPARDTAAVVTNDFHLARSRLLAARESFGRVIGVPAKLPWVHLEINYYIREAFAMVKTLLFD